MDTLEAIRERRAVKHYDPNFIMPEAEVKTLYEHIRLAPTSFNIQHCRLVRVQNKQQREQIKALAWGQAQVTEASELFILCADVEAWKKDPARYWSEAPQEVQDILVPMIMPFYEGNHELARDEAMRSVGIVAQTLMLAAKSLGYDSCPMIGFDQQEVAKLINLPSDHAIGMMIVVGKGIKPAHSKGGFLSESEVFFVDSF